MKAIGTKGPLNPHELRKIAVAAGCDPRSVRARLEGRSQHSTMAARIDDALRSFGLLPVSSTTPEMAKAG